MSDAEDQKDERPVLFVLSSPLSFLALAGAMSDYFLSFFRDSAWHRYVVLLNRAEEKTCLNSHSAVKLTV